MADPDDGPKLIVKRTPEWEHHWKSEVFSWGLTAGLNHTRVLRQIFESPNDALTYAEGYYIGSFLSFLKEDELKEE